MTLSPFNKSLWLIWLFHKKLFQYVLILIFSLIILSLFLSALLAGTLYYANKNGHLQQWLNHGIKGVQIEYQQADVSWHHADPTLHLTGVKIIDTQTMTEPLKLNSITIDFSVWRSLAHWQLVTDNLTISGLELDIQQEKDGSLQLLGINQKAAVTSTSRPNPMIMRWFLAQNGLHLQDMLLNLHLHNGESLGLKVDEMNWVNDFGYHFDLEGSVPQIPESVLKMDANFVPGENPFDLDAWHVSFNGGFEGKDFTPLFLKRNIYNVDWISGGGKINFNGSWDNNALQTLDVYIDLNNVNLGNSTSQGFISPKFDEAIFWRAKSTGGWDLMLKPVDNAENSIPSLLAITYDPNTAQPWSMSAQDMDMRLIGQWVGFWFAPTTYAAKVMQALKPTGTIEAMAASAGKAGGHLSIQSKQLAISPNPIFPKGLPASDVNLDVDWQFPSRAAILENITLHTFSVSNPWLKVAMAGAASIPTINPKNPSFNFQGTVTGQNLEQVKAFYVPEAFVPKDLTDWLLQGLVKLPTVTGSFALKGALADFPFVNGQGLFQINLHVVGAEVSPWAEWPLITNLTGDLQVKNQVFTIDSDQAKTTGVDLHHVQLQIADLRPKEIKDIVITGQANPTGDQALNYLAAMPLTEPKLQTWLNSLSLSGNIPLQLNLLIPLEDHQPIVATGDATLNQNAWTLGENKAPLLSNITGQLHFVNDVISAPNLSFYALGQTLEARIPPSSLNHMQLFFQHFVFLGQDFPGLEMEFVSQNDKTVLNFTHPLVTGTLFLTGQQQAIEAHFNEFHLPMAGPNEAENQTLLGAFLSRIPPLTVIVDQLYYGNNLLGQFSWDSVPLPDGIQINRLNLNGKDVTLLTAARIQTFDGQDEFKISGILGSNNFGNLLTEFNYPGIVSGGVGRIQFNLNWLGGILKPEWPTFEGNLDFNITDGKLLKVNTGLARVFGLVSLDTIFSTLSLNFDKMLSSGLAFDSMAGGYTIQNGVATVTKAGIKVKGPSLSLTLKGSMDFNTQTLNQTATVMPQVGTSVAIAAAFLAGPVVGVAAWFADKLLGSTLFKNTGLNYNVTGTFDKPIVSMSQPAASASTSS